MGAPVKSSHLGAVPGLGAPVIHCVEIALNKLDALETYRGCFPAGGVRVTEGNVDLSAARRSAGWHRNSYRGYVCRPGS